QVFFGRLWEATCQGASNRVNRGGNFNNTAANLRAAWRNNNTPTNRNNNIGWRCAKTTAFVLLPLCPRAERGARPCQSRVVRLASPCGNVSGDGAGAQFHSPPWRAADLGVSRSTSEA